MTVVDYFVVVAMAVVSLLLGITLQWAYQAGASKPRLVLMALLWLAAVMAMLLGLGKT